MNNKIMAGGNLEDIVNRLTRCCALLECIAAGSTVSTEVVGAIRDLLKSICIDFRADIDGSE